MTRRGAGWALVALGAVLLIAGLVGLLNRSSSPPDLQAAGTTTSTTAAETTTTLETITTSTAATTTTTIAPTTTLPVTTVPGETVEQFVEAFNNAVETDDETFLFDRLHPVIVEAYGVEPCREWISREIVELSDYRLTGNPVGPEPRTIDTPQGEREIDLISAPVSFVFQGQSFEASAGFSIVDGLAHWVGECT